MAKRAKLQEMSIKLQKSNFTTGVEEDHSEHSSIVETEQKKKKRITMPGHRSFTPPSGLTPVSSEEEEENMQETISDQNEEPDEDYRNEAYFSLPENVRKAIDFAKTK